MNSTEYRLCALVHMLWDGARVGLHRPAVCEVKWVLVDAMVGSLKLMVGLSVEVSAESSKVTAVVPVGRNDKLFTVVEDPDVIDGVVDDIVLLVVEADDGQNLVFSILKDEGSLLGEGLLHTIHTKNQRGRFVQRQNLDLVVVEESFHGLLVGGVLDGLVEDGEVVLLVGILNSQLPAVSLWVLVENIVVGVDVFTSNGAVRPGQFLEKSH